ncbi:hypothetical protein JRO89_XS05G0243200 [Xanthoceras sorbifolium]|uniref:ATPase AAA-type core domain-containing protein n=1 Tax=Xanthoceras sorbifolium TaxID=99658 RepID=A0ABQ8I347_9ROSI|nr:hypothetical protein JRO89_XS05G0243200 [Xanthoceras sorbifolium]
MSNTEILHRRVESCTIKYSNLDGIVGYLRDSYTDYRRTKEKPFIRMVQQTLYMINKSNSTPSPGKKNFKRKVDDDVEERLQSLEKQHIKRRRMGPCPYRKIPPGCGKTKLAHAIANETAVPFYKIFATEVVSGVSGEGKPDKGEYVYHTKQAICIAGFIMTGAFAHGAIFFIRDYNPEQNEDNVLARMLDHKEAIISHLSWASLFLGFHTLELYVHNDVMLAFGPGDFLVHHAIALGLHTTTLILVNDALDARGFKLMPDKKDFGYSFDLSLQVLQEMTIRNRDSLK